MLIVGGILAFLYIGATVLLPLVVAAIIAILLYKPTQKLQQWGLPNWLAISISIVLMVVIFYR